MAPKKGGIKRRLGLEPEAAPDHAPPPPEALNPAERRSIRQRVGQPSASSSGPPQHQPDNEPLTDKLKEEWGKGVLSSKRVQEFAQAAQGQGARGLEAIAAAGTSGRTPQHIQQTLMRIFGKPTGCPDFTWAEIPFAKKGRAVHPFLLPHSWLASLHDNNQNKFEKTVTGPEGACSAFWTMMAGTDFARDLPILGPLDRTLPIGLHGDGGAYSKQDSVLVLTWNSLLGSGCTKAKRYLLTCIRKTDLAPGTLDAIFEILGWSFNVMATGVCPEKDWLGRAQPHRSHYLAQGYRGVRCQVRGDLEFVASIFAFPKWNEAAKHVLAV